MTLLTLTPTGVAADEAAILKGLETYFENGVPESADRRALIELLESDPAFDRSRLGEWLHELPLYEDLKPGRQQIQIEVGYGHRRLVTPQDSRGLHARPGMAVGLRSASEWRYGPFVSRQR